MSDALVDRVLAGEPQGIARALSVVIDGAPGAESLLRELHPRTGQACLIGITGPPGAGKSTLVDRLIIGFRERGLSVAVLAVDPTSPLTGGAVLGDRVRMQTHAGDRGVFVRSMATRGHLGGLTATTGAAAAVLDAAGFDVVVIETVGVGQGEVEIANLADLSIVLVVPGAGDDVQALKAGLLEIADIFVVNKADREGADRMAASVEGMLALAPGESGAWQPPVLRTIATEGTGIGELIEAIERFRRDAAPEVEARRRRRADSSRNTGRPIVDHVGIAVRDATGILGFLDLLTGVQAGAPEDVPGQDVRVQFVNTDGVRLELLAPLSPGSAISKFLDTRGPGLHHIAFRVADLAATLRALASRGVRLIDEKPRAGAGGAAIAFIHPSSAGGVLVELVGEGAQS